MERIKIAILFGGCSEEYRISLKSAYSVITSIDREKYDPVMIGITREGEWFRYDGPADSVLNDTWKSSEHCNPAFIAPDRSTHGIWELRENQVVRTRLDVVFPVLHGKMGEDGAIQGLLELAGIPYVGCGLPSSAICMDKELAKRIVQSAGVAIPRFNVIYSGSAEPGRADEGLIYPLFIKPANSGSSFGVTKAVNCGELAAAIDEAARFDHKILVEEAVAGFEVGCAVLGSGDELIMGEIDQIELSHGFFRIHQEAQPEISSDNSTIHVPARITPEMRRHIWQTAGIVYRALGCSGLARVDMFMTSNQQIVFNEVNTMPGFTSYSRYPRMMAAAGISMEEIVEKAINLAITGTGKEIAR